MEILSYYASFESNRQKAEFRDKVIEKCGMAYPTFMAKIRNNTWNKLEREAVEEIIKEFTTADEKEK
jgi:hypothetical protein